MLTRGFILMFFFSRVTPDSGHKVLDHLHMSSVSYTRVPYRPVSLCMNSSNGASFLHRGLLFFFFTQLLLCCLLFSTRDFSRTIVQLWISLIPVFPVWWHGGLSLLVFWTTGDDTPWKRSMLPLHVDLSRPEKPNWTTKMVHKEVKTDGYVLVGLSRQLHTTSPEDRHVPFHKASGKQGHSTKWWI